MPEDATVDATWLPRPRGYVTLRPIAEDIMFHPEEVVGTVRAAVEHRAATTGVHNVALSTRKGPARAL